MPHEAQLQSESAHEQGALRGNLHVKRVEMLNAQEEEESYETEQEADAPMGNYERQLNQVRDSFDPPSPRTQTDLSDAVPRLAFMDHPSEELYWPISSIQPSYDPYQAQRMSPLDSSRTRGSGLLIRMPMTIPRGFLTTQIVTPPAWSTMMYWRNGWPSTSQRQNNSMPLSSSRTRDH